MDLVAGQEKGCLLWAAVGAGAWHQVRGLSDTLAS